MATVTEPLPVGDLLRSWRRRRSLSQLELSLNAGVSSRHLSFLETGRARPRREMLPRPAEGAQGPPARPHALLLAPGFAPLYGERSLDEEPMSIASQAIDRFLRA